MAVKYGCEPKQRYLVKFVDGGVTPVSNDPLGALKDAYLLLRGSLHYAAFAHIHEPQINIGYPAPTCLLVQKRRVTGYAMELGSGGDYAKSRSEFLSN